MATVNKLGLMVWIIMEIGIEIKYRVSVHLYMLMEIFMRVNLIKIMHMVKENLSRKIQKLYLKVNFSIISPMEKQNKISAAAQFIKVALNAVKNMDMENINGQINLFIRGSGKMVR